MILRNSNLINLNTEEPEGPILWMWLSILLILSVPRRYVLWKIKSFFPNILIWQLNGILSIISGPAARNISTESHHCNESNSRNRPRTAEPTKWNPRKIRSKSE